MDFDRDGKVSFDEFVRWYSMSSALDKPLQPLPEEGQEHDRYTGTRGYTDPDLEDADDGGGATGGADSPSQTALVPAGRRAVAAPSRTPDGASRLLADLEGLSLHKEGLDLNNTPRLDSRREESPPARGLARGQSSVEQREGGTGRGSRGRGLAGRNLPRGQANWTAVPGRSTGRSLRGVGSDATGMPSAVSTEAEKDATRERWLSGAVVTSPEGRTLDARLDATLDATSWVRPSAFGGSASDDLERALDMLRVLVKASADADTLIAALASCMIRNTSGR